LGFLTLLQNVIRELLLGTRQNQNLDNDTFSDLRHRGQVTSDGAFGYFTAHSDSCSMYVLSLLCQIPQYFRGTWRHIIGFHRIQLMQAGIPFVVSGSETIIFPAYRANITHVFSQDHL